MTSHALNPISSQGTRVCIIISIVAFPCRCFLVIIVLGCNRRSNFIWSDGRVGGFASKFPTEDRTHSIRIELVHLRVKEEGFI